MTPETVIDWPILIEDTLAFNPDSSTKLLNKNIYEGYDERFISTKARIRSLTEQQLEIYIEKCNNVKNIYKNGDGGKEYFSIVYYDGFFNKREFYPDYILVMNDNSIMIVETKGGEFGGEYKNIDKTAKLKFTALKNYAKEYNLKWGFVRLYEIGLKFNNTMWSDKMGKDTEWKNIEEVLK